MSPEPAYQEWLIASVKSFRALGFWGGYRALSDSDLAATLEGLQRQETGAPGQAFDPEDRFTDLALLRPDWSRVWWDDTEADVCAENKVYEQTLEEWGQISRGAFNPTNIRETWEAEEGPIRVAFTLGGQTVQLRPRFMDDYLDVGILTAINRALRASGIQFAAFEFFDQTAFIVALTREEKQKLERERGWRFADL